MPARIPTLKPRIPTLDTRIAVAAAPRQQKVADGFYSSSAWIELRDRVRREAGGRCQVPGCTKRGRWVDHIVEIKDGGAKLDRNNCMLMCASHHTAKTMAMKAKRSNILKHGAAHPQT